MKAAIRAEIRKLFTVRSTYIILGITLALLIFYGFYIAGWRIDRADLLNPNTMMGNITGAITTVSIFLGIISLLLLSHEWRYNTIMYSLTSSNSRSKVLLAKILVITGLAIVFTVAAGVLAPLMVTWGIHAHGLKLVHQTIYYRTLIWECLFYGWGYAMAALVITALIRNQIGSIVTLFIVPGTVEALLGLLLKKNVVYLPFSALDTVIGAQRGDATSPGAITPLHAAMVFVAYLVVGWAIAWALFLKRDATNASS